MLINYSDFIGHYEGVFEDGFCEHLINEFEHYYDNGFCGNRKDGEGAAKTQKSDSFAFINYLNHAPRDYKCRPSLDIFREGLQRCYEDYVNEYDILRDLHLRSSAIKMQRTDPGGGYHLWHYERGHEFSCDISAPGRLLVYILYLNTIDPENAGETEFFYQRKRISPKENTLVIWPATFTHTHRGNTLFGDKSKYIVTGWFHLD